MGFKSLTLQMVPLCLHISVRPEDDLPSPKPSSPATTVRLILSNGKIRVFRRSFPAAELMASNPLHLVCRSDRLFIGQKVPPLAAGDLLVPGQSYFLLPSDFFSSALSFVSLASSFGAASKLLLLRPFEIRKTGEGKLQLRVSDEFVERLGEEEEEEDGEGEEKKKEGRMVCTTEEMEKEYRELVVRAKLWKPKLETISESERKRRGGGGVVGFTGMRRKEKIKRQSKDQQRS